MANLFFPFNHIPIGQIEWPDQDRYQSDLVSFIKEYDENNKINQDEIIADNIKYNLFESAPTLDFLDRAICYNDVKIPLNNLMSFVKESLKALFYELWNRQDQSPFTEDVKVKIIESWYHITQYGGYHDTHSHHAVSWSGIYFLDVKECGPKNGNIRFYKPFTTVESYQDDIGLSWCKNDMIDIFPKNGEIVLFPGFLPHAALPYFGKSDRMAIAFNMIITS